MIIESAFRHHPLIRGEHGQTVFSTLFRQTPNVPYKRERLELPDGDFVDIDWGPDAPGPIVILLHGLEGSSGSFYMLGMTSSLAAMGWQALALNFRSCSGEMNRLPRFYHSGETGDLAFLVEHLQLKSRRPMAAVGYSLGGNVLLRYLGEKGSKSPFFAAAAVSVPYLLKEASRRIHQGMSVIYERRFLRLLEKKSQAKAKAFPEHGIDGRTRFTTLYEFDNQVTAPIHGFKSAADYYKKCSSMFVLDAIQTPSLLVHAKDDPFMTESVIPKPANLSKHLRLELSSQGGHVGFVGRGKGLRPTYFLEQRIPEFLKQHAE